MAITWQGFSNYVQMQVTAVQAAAGRAIDTSIGSVTLAYAQATAAVALWLQALIVSLLAASRAATAVGALLDSWMADWFFNRPGAVFAQTTVTFARATPTNSASIPAGTTVSTGPGGVQFSVQADTTNGAWNAATNSYVLASGVSSVTVPVIALVAGTSGNVGAATITSFVQPILYIDTVSNPAAVVNGVDAASDPAFRLLFQLYILSLARGTPAAITYAAVSYQQNLTVAIAEFTDTSGAYRPGHSVVTIDDGTGSPSSTLIAAVNTIVQGYRPIGSVVVVQGPTTTAVSVNAELTLLSGIPSAVVIAAVSAALSTYIDTLAVGQTLPFSRILQVIYDTDAAITNVTGVTVNSGTADITPSQFGVLVPGTMTVSVT